MDARLARAVVVEIPPGIVCSLRALVRVTRGAKIEPNAQRRDAMLLVAAVAIDELSEGQYHEVSVDRGVAREVLLAREDDNVDLSQATEPELVSSTKFVEASVGNAVQVLQALTADVQEFDSGVFEALVDVDAEGALLVHGFSDDFADRLVQCHEIGNSVPARTLAVRHPPTEA